DPRYRREPPCDSPAPRQRGSPFRRFGAGAQRRHRSLEPCRASMGSVPYTLALARSNITLNPRLPRLQPSPFERLRQWFAGVAANPALMPINLSIGEPRHPTPAFVLEALAAAGSGLANYPTTIGAPALRE